MKKILIATDFSNTADHAARYSISLASQLGLDIMLIHAASERPDSPLQIILPSEDYEIMVKRTNDLLERHADLLMKSAVDYLDTNQKIPKISAKSSFDSIANLLRETIQHDHIGLVILGLSGNGDLKRLVHGSCSRDVIDFAEYPALLIPQGADFVPIKKIAFATDLSTSDMEMIQILALFAAKLNAELLIVHVITDRKDRLVTHRIDVFMKELNSKVSYGKLYYKNVYQPKIEDGLNWLSDHGGTDMLALIHRKHSFTSDILHGSHSQKLARETNLPLLIIPEGYKSTLF